VLFFAEHLQRQIMQPLTICLAVKVPLMPRGALRPVKLPCCAFTVSHLGFQTLVRAGKCAFCKDILDAGAEALEVRAPPCMLCMHNWMATRC
jgi:hypothetical protein